MKHGREGRGAAVNWLASTIRRLEQRVKDLDENEKVKAQFRPLQSGWTTSSLSVTKKSTSRVLETKQALSSKTEPWKN